MSGCLQSAYLWDAKKAGWGFCSYPQDTEPQVFGGGHWEKQKAAAVWFPSKSLRTFPKHYYTSVKGYSDVSVVSLKCKMQMLTKC